MRSLSPFIFPNNALLLHFLTSELLTAFFRLMRYGWYDFEVQFYMNEAAGASLIYLPPYSPDFSPIENCFAKIKNTLRSISARTYLDLLQAIEEAFSQVSLEDLKGWFTHCCYCTSPA